VTLQRSVQQSAILSLTLELTFFRSLSIPESQLSKTWTFYRGKAITDKHIPELMKFRYVILRRLKNAGKSLWLDKAILQIIKPLKMVFCSSCDGVPLKFKKKNWQASSLPAQNFSLLLTLLEFA
jgi:hypothetical protein